MDSKARKRKEEKKRKEREKQRRYTAHRLLQRKRRISLLEKHRKRRKKDCIIGMPFIVAFHGDPAQLFYCADYPTSYELIPRTDKYNWNFDDALDRLKRYMTHFVTQIHGRVLIWKAG